MLSYLLFYNKFFQNARVKCKQTENREEIVTQDIVVFIHIICACGKNYRLLLIKIFRFAYKAMFEGLLTVSSTVSRDADGKNGAYFALVKGGI